MLITVIAGIITGFVVSIPPLGPIAFALISKGFRGELKEGMAIAFGSAFMDMVYAMIAFSGISLLFLLLPDAVENFYINHMNGLQIALIYAGCIVVVIYGLRIMKIKIDFQEFETQKSEVVHRAEVKAEEFVHKHAVQLKKDNNLFGMFVMGILLCLSSITLPASWIAIVGYIKSFKIIESSIIGGLVFSAGAFAGTALWFFTLLRLITGNKHRINRNTVSKLNIIAGFILLILGVTLFVKATGTVFNIL
jgi:threonine/homoserine/homoserine lactone efflux protein